MKIQLTHKFEDIISIENLLSAWKEFVNGKRNKKDVQEFSMRLMDNIFSLHNDLANHTYNHGGYQAFKINDPKPRDIHKATVRDRLLHHAIYRILYPFFDKTFIPDSYSCRLEKGTHKAINRFREFAYKAGKNNTKTCWILKGDIGKFFANIDHEILKDILAKHIGDKNVLWLFAQVIDSFNTTSPYPLLRKERGNANRGLPLGNLTSQLFVNVYMNKFDQFVKHKLKEKFYIRYADDFVIFSESETYLKKQIFSTSQFLENELKLKLHPDKVSIKTLASGIDFLGWVNFHNHRVLRTMTKKRMVRRIRKNSDPEKLNSYLGLLKHGNTQKIQAGIRRVRTLD